MTKRRAFWDAVLAVTIPSLVIWGAIAVWIASSYPGDFHLSERVAGLGCLGTLTMLLPIAFLIYRNSTRPRREAAPLIGVATFIALNMLGLLTSSGRAPQHHALWTALQSVGLTVLTLLTVHRFWTEWQARRVRRG